MDEGRRSEEIGGGPAEPQIDAEARSSCFLTLSVSPFENRVRPDQDVGILSLRSEPFTAHFRSRSMTRISAKICQDTSREV